MQRLGSVPIFCINVNCPTGSVINFEENADDNINFEAKCERILTECFYHVDESCQRGNGSYKLHGTGTRKR